MKSFFLKLYILLIPISKVWHLPWLGYKLQLSELAFIPLIYTSRRKFKLLTSKGFWKPVDVIVILFPLVYLLTSIMSGVSKANLLEIIQIFYVVTIYFIFRLIGDSTFLISIPGIFVVASLFATVLGIAGWLLFSVFHIENPLVTARVYPYMGYTVQAKALTYSPLVLSSILATGICFQLAEIMVHKDRRTTTSWLILTVLLAGMMVTLSKTVVCLLAGWLAMVEVSKIWISSRKRKRILTGLTFLTVLLLGVVYVTGTHFYFLLNKDESVPRLVTEGFVTPNPVLSFRIGETQVELLPTSYYHLKKNAGIAFYRSSGMGVGPGRFREVLINYRNEGLYPSTMATFPPHSTYSGALAENGLAGFLLILCFFAFVGRIIWQNLRQSPSVFSLGMTGIFITMVIEALAIDTMGFRHYWVLFGIAAALPINQDAVK